MSPVADISCVDFHPVNNYSASIVQCCIQYEYLSILSLNSMLAS
jgi:hypothetical protein